MSVLDNLKSTWKSLKNEQKGAIISTPIIIALVLTLIFMEEDPNASKKEVSQEAIQNEESMRNLKMENDKIDNAINFKDRLKKMKASENKYDFNDDDIEAYNRERGLLSSYDSVETESEGLQQTTLSAASTQQAKPIIKYVYTNASKSKQQTSTPVKQETKSTSQDDSKYKRRTSLNNSFVQPDYSNQYERQDFIDAVVDRTQTIRNNGEIRLRTTEEAIINDKVVPKNTYMSGVVTFRGDRVLVHITSFELKGNYERTSLYVYDKGMEGIYVPGGVDQEIGKDAVSDAIDVGGTSVTIPMIGTISSSAGKKKVKDPTVVIPEEYIIKLKKEIRR